MATTWNPSDKGTNVTLSNGNNTATWTGYEANTRGLYGKSSDKLYLEFTTTGASYIAIGLANSSAPLNSDAFSSSGIIAYRGYNGNILPGNSAYGAAYADGDVIGVAVNFTDGKITFYKNNTSQGVITGLPSGTLFPFAMGCSSGFSMSATLRTETSQFSYTPPSGYSAWDTATAAAKDQASTGGQ